MSTRLRLLAVAVLMTSLSSALGLAAPDDADDVRSAVAGFATAWNRHDMDAFGRLFAPDATFVNVAGVVMKGRQDIQLHHAWGHGTIPESTRVPGTAPANYGIFRQSRMTFDAVAVRFLRKDVALASVSWTLSGDVRTPTRKGELLFVLTRDAGRWLIAAGQNTEINRTVK